MRGVIYARYSSDAQREESIDAQIRENNANESLPVYHVKNLFCLPDKRGFLQ